MKLIINLTKYALIASTIVFVYLVVIGDKYFQEKTGFSPQEFGAQYHMTVKQLFSLTSGYYEYDMTPENFHNMRKKLIASGFWVVRTYPIFDIPHFHYSKSKNCSCFFLSELQHSILFMAYDERRNILYSGYYET